MSDLRVDETAELFKALSSAARLRILVSLIDASSDVTALADQTGLSQPLVSQHLRTLRLAGLVQVQRIGRNGVYSVRDEHVAHIVQDAMTHAGESDG